ncbi:MAG: hypothetical protein R3F61_07010 [Myxococcota bacterium]
MIAKLGAPALVLVLGWGCTNDPDGPLTIEVVSGTVELNGVPTELTGKARCHANDPNSDFAECDGVGNRAPGSELPSVSYSITPSVLTSAYESAGSQLLAYEEEVRADLAIENGVDPNDVYRFVDPAVTREPGPGVFYTHLTYRNEDRDWQSLDLLTWVQQVNTCSPLTSDGELSSCEVTWNGTFYDNGLSNGGPERLVLLTTELEITGMLPPEAGGGGPGKNCYVGTWVSPPGCNNESATLTLDSDGTGEVTSVDCSGTCPTSSNVLYFTWTESSGTLSMDISGGLTCGQSNPVTLTQDISTSCDGDTLLVNGEPYTRR